MVLTNLCRDPTWLRMHWHHLKNVFGLYRCGEAWIHVPNRGSPLRAHPQALRTPSGTEHDLHFLFWATDRTMLFLLFVKSREWHTNRKAGMPAIVFSRAFQSIVSRLLVQLGKGSLSLSPPCAHDFVLLVLRHVCVLWIGSSF